MQMNLHCPTLYDRQQSANLAFITYPPARPNKTRTVSLKNWPLAQQPSACVTCILVHSSGNTIQ